MDSSASTSKRSPSGWWRFWIELTMTGSEAAPVWPVARLADSGLLCGGGRRTNEHSDSFGADPRHLGGELGTVAVLHTGGQTLGQHVHLHCVVTGGALARDGARAAWRPWRSRPPSRPSSRPSAPPTGSSTPSRPSRAPRR